MDKFKIGIVGGTGYTAGELIRILVNHPAVEIDFVYSTSMSGSYIFKVHDDLLGQCDLKFSSEVNPEVDALFLCLGHGNSKNFLSCNYFSPNTAIIDLSNDFRLKGESVFMDKQFVYGLLELNKESIKNSKFIANPGCFATAIQLSLLPLAKASLLKGDIHINATTGSTGAGASLSHSTHYSWRNNNFSSYKEFQHQHIDEIKESVAQLQPNFDFEIYFIPNRGSFSRGIFASSYTYFDGDLDNAYKLFEDFYSVSQNVLIHRGDIHLKQVVNSNRAVISLSKYKDQLLISAAIDNLLLGASGQAVQNFNLMFNLPELMGLKLKASYF